MDSEKILSELEFKAVRSSGAGGQNVNKVSAKVVLSFDLNHSKALSDQEKNLLNDRIGSRLSSDKILILNCDEDRSQIKNKAIVIKRFLQIIGTGLIVPKIRKVTKTPKAVIRQRLKEKKNISELKKNRRKPEF